jgi:hypothetical protein
MPTADKPVRQSVTLPANVAVQVRRLAKARRLSANRMLLELIENGMAAERRKQKEFFDLAERFRMPPIRQRSNARAIRWAEWSLAADAKN